MNIDPHTASQEIGRVIEDSHAVFDKTDNDVALAFLWSATAYMEHHYCRFGAGFEAAVKAMHHADAAGLRFFARDGRGMAAAEVLHGPMPALEGLNWLTRMQDASPFYEPLLDYCKAGLLAYMGSFDEARSRLDASHAAFLERGEMIWASLDGMGRAHVEAAAGNHVEAEKAARRGCMDLEQLGERGFLSTALCLLAESLYELGQFEEAEASARRGLEIGASDDIATQAGASEVLAKLAARRVEPDEALSLGRRAVALAESTESPMHRGETLLNLAEVHRLLGDDAKARVFVEAAIEQFEQKGATAFVEQARRILFDLETKI